MTGSDTRSARPDPTHPAASFAARTFWMLVGNGLLLLLAIGILQRPAWTTSHVDVAFWAVVAALLAVRAVDVVWLSGRTADGEPATSVHLRRYGLGLAATAAAAWALAQSVEI
jgi:hypothetical protein